MAQKKIIKQKPERNTDTKVGKSTQSAESTSLSVPVVSIEGKEGGSITLPEAIFGGKVNLSLIAQAVRVYLNNQKAHFSNTKTRSEVRGSTRKIFRQKGTGRARHGAIRAPIFVGGGIALGPKFRKNVLNLPKKMKKAALVAALSYKHSAGEVIGINGLDKVTGKTSQMRDFLKKVGKKEALIVTDKESDVVQRSVRNLPNLQVINVDQLNTLEVVRHETLMFTKEAAEKLASRINSLPPKEEKGEKEVSA